ncbi:sensor histidine kinase [Micromonospora sp. NBC_01813]|uniref:sensor histidine kinase n=1 Tax=Micromonospora sp. NBC_01813 TaxID=2975988 RepID=UPI002DDC084E|nr:sensor histidine kinase [Micromonospora sp. NBC_01813]WSA09495.1 sensor histidine kinase [Micromonospora sp. NBC_01813]
MPVAPAGLPRLPLGAWTALIWSIGAFSTLRAYSGLPGMPSGLPAPPSWCWVLAAVAVVTGLGATTQVSRRPLATLHLMVVSAVVLVLAVGTEGIANHPDQVLSLFLLAADVVLARIVVTRPPWVWGVALVSVLAAMPVSAVLRAVFRQPGKSGETGLHFDWTVWMAIAVLPAVVAGLLGYSIRQTREYARRISEQAAEQAVVAERLRISRELHDHVAHSVGVIALQAGAAARVMDSQPDQAREALRAIETTSRETLSGLRRMLGGLRQAEEAPLRPAPGLADVERLVGTATAAGVVVDLTVSGERRALPADVELSAYRIIQEALTNVLRHAHAETCRISVEYSASVLAIEVVDDGQGGELADGGFGLTGLRERVALVNGTITAGTRRGGGFQVTARLPVGT